MKTRLLKRLRKQAKKDVFIFVSCFDDEYTFAIHTPSQDYCGYYDLDDAKVDLRYYRNSHILYLLKVYRVERLNKKLRKSL